MKKIAVDKSHTPIGQRRVDTRTLVVILFLVLSVAGVYWRVTSHEFITYDDNHYIYENNKVQSGFNWDSILWAFTTGAYANWHPLTWLSHMLDYELYGLNAGGHHFTNLVFHIVNTVLVFVVFRRMTGGYWSSAFVAAIFGLHPLHVESVAWAAERKDVLSTLFWLLTMLMYVRYTKRPETKSYLLMVVFFALGLMAKPMLVTLPFVLLLLDLWPLRRIRFERTASASGKPQAGSLADTDDRGVSFLGLIKEKVPLFILSAISSVVTYIVQQQGGAFYPLERMPIALRLGNAVVSYVTYIRKVFWPSDLAIFYPHPIYTLSLSSVVLGAAILLALTALFIWLGRNHRYIAVGWLWYLGTLVPVIGIVQVGLQAMADRYSYIPLIGLSIILAWGIPELLGRLRHAKSILGAAGGASLLSLTVLTWFQVGHWRDTMTLFSHAISVTEGNYRALTILGLQEVKDGKTDDAIAHYYKALEIIPTLWDVHNYLGIALAKQGKIVEASSHYAEAVRLKPDYQEAHFNLGLALDRQGKTDEAIPHFTEAVRLRPDDAEAQNSLGAALGKQGRLEEAIEHFREAIRIRPEYASALYNLGFAFLKQEKYEEAVHHLSEVVRLNPSHANAQHNLGLALLRIGKIEQAIKHYSEALRINPRNTAARAELEQLIKKRKGLAAGRESRSQ